MPGWSSSANSGFLRNGRASSAARSAKLRQNDQSTREPHHRRVGDTSVCESEAAAAFEVVAALAQVRVGVADAGTHNFEEHFLAGRGGSRQLHVGDVGAGLGDRERVHVFLPRSCRISHEKWGHAVGCRVLPEAPCSPSRRTFPTTAAAAGRCFTSAHVRTLRVPHACCDPAAHQRFRRRQCGANQDASRRPRSSGWPGRTETRSL